MDNVKMYEDIKDALDELSKRKVRVQGKINIAVPEDEFESVKEALLLATLTVMKMEATLKEAEKDIQALDEFCGTLLSVFMMRWGIFL